MKVFIATVGTRGDVQPFLALGLELQKRGCSVTICTHACFETFISGYGLRHAPLNNDIIDLIHSDEGKRALETAGNLWGMLKMAVRFLPKIGSMQRRGIQELWASTEMSSPDLILFHPKAVGMTDFAERLKVPCLMGFFMPMFSPTCEFPAIVFPRLPLGAWYNRMTYNLIDRASWWGTRKYINEWRVENGMAARRGRSMLEQANGEPVPVVYGFSGSVVPRPADWPATASVSGYWFIDGDSGWTPTPQLRDFLSNGEAPVYIGFGSMAGLHSKRLGEIVLGAVEKAGVRAILATGWGGLDLSGRQLPGTVIEIEKVPHDWLFPRVSAVVHHGGCGTTAEGLRAGRPTVVCPFFGDQPFWGNRVAELGAGPAPIPQKKLTINNLSAAIGKATGDPSIRKKADLLGQKIRSEEGLGNAVEFIKQWMNSRRC